MIALPPPAGPRYVVRPGDDMDRHPAMTGFFHHLAVDCGQGTPDNRTANQWCHDWANDKRARRERSARFAARTDERSPRWARR